MKSAIIHRDAQAELDEAIAWYEQHQKGLGLGLNAEVERAIASIEQNPEISPHYKNADFRFCRVRRFPYVLYYLSLEDAVWVAAIAHVRRQPDYWSQRRFE